MWHWVGPALGSRPTHMQHDAHVIGVPHAWIPARPAGIREAFNSLGHGPIGVLDFLWIPGSFVGAAFGGASSTGNRPSIAGVRET